MRSPTITEVFVLVHMIVFLSFGFAQAADDAGQQERLAKHYRMEKPAGPGPFAAVLLVHGCSGFHADFMKVPTMDLTILN